MFNFFSSKRSIASALFLSINFISFSQARIIMNGATMKMVNGVYVSTSDLSIAGGSVIADSSTIKIAGNISNAGIFDLRNGTLEMNGTAPQIIPANSISYNTLKNLVASNDFNLAGQDSVTGVLSFGASNKTINTGGFLTLKSTASKTARFADITNAGALSGNSIMGNVHVERYISAVRAWRLLTAPINITGAQTINQAWQEGASNPSLVYTGNINPLPGYGMHISGGTAVNGFDPGVNLNAAIKRYSGGVWAPLANTKSTLITSANGFMVFFRGNRSTNLSLGTYAPVTSAVLRSTGYLKTNDQTFTVTDTGFTVIGNPYASPINLHQIAKINSINIQDNFYLWDPKLTGSNGVGGYINISWDADNSMYDITPTSPSGLNQYVQSSSAFFSKTINGTSAGTLIIKEKDKYSFNINANRGSNNSTGKIRTNLYSFNTDGTISIVDGILNSYGPKYSNSIDKDDAVKIKNTNESLFTIRDGKSLVVERKQLVTDADTIFINMLKMQVKSYKFEFDADNFNTSGLTGVLEDSYTNIHTTLDLTGKTVYNFTVVNVPGSWNPGRFQVVFKQLMVLPVTLSNIKAFAQNENIIVEWKVENELNIKQYDIERSADGQKFFKTISVKAKGNNNGASTYNWLDKDVLESNNYYRLKSLGLNGEIKYSSVVKVYMGKDKPMIILTTNVITNKMVTFQMHNMPNGQYAVNISNTLGQLIYMKKIEHPGGSSIQNIQLIQNTVTGIYNLEIIKPDLSVTTMKLLLQ